MLNSSYPSTDLANNTGDVLKGADKGPIQITQYRKPRYVLMTIEDFGSLSERASTQEAFFSNEIPQELDAAFDAEINKIIEG